MNGFYSYLDKKLISNIPEKVSFFLFEYRYEIFFSVLIPLVLSIYVLMIFFPYFISFWDNIEIIKKVIPFFLLFVILLIRSKTIAYFTNKRYSEEFYFLFLINLESTYFYKIIIENLKNLYNKERKNISNKFLRKEFQKVLENLILKNSVSFYHVAASMSILNFFKYLFAELFLLEFLFTIPSLLIFEELFLNQLILFIFSLPNFLIILLILLEEHESLKILKRVVNRISFLKFKYNNHVVFGRIEKENDNEYEVFIPLIGSDLLVLDNFKRAKSVILRKDKHKILEKIYVEAPKNERKK